jgi:hypothetical protein
MKFRKTLAIIMACALFATLSVAASARLVIDLGAEFAAMMEDEGTYLQKAGGPDFTFADGKITVSGRTADWNAVDFIFNNLEAGVDYTLIVNFACDVPSRFLIAQADNPWGWLEHTDADATTGTVSLDFKLDSSLLFDGQNRVRLFQADAATDDYSITGITLLGGAAADGGATQNAGGATGGTTGGADDEKHGADTGIADVAVASAIAIVAAGAVIFSRKKK